MGSLFAEMVVKPTMSLKYSETLSKYSGLTVPPTFRASATDLKKKKEEVHDTFDHLQFYMFDLEVLIKYLSLKHVSSI